MCILTSTGTFHILRQKWIVIPRNCSQTSYLSTLGKRPKANLFQTSLPPPSISLLPFPSLSPSSLPLSLPFLSPSLPLSPSFLPSPLSLIPSYRKKVVLRTKLCALVLFAMCECIA